MKNKLSVNLVYSFLFILIFKEIVFSNSFFELNSILSLSIDFIAYIIFILHIFKKLKLSRNKMLLLLVIGLITFVSAILLMNFTLFTSYLIFVLSIVEDKKKIIKTIFVSILLSIILVIFVYVYNYRIGAVAKVFEFNGRTRHFFGYTSPNMISFYAIWAYLAFFYLNHKKKKLIIFSSIPVLILYMYTKSNTMLLILFLSIVLLFISKYKTFNNIINFLCKNGLLLILLFLFISIFLYKMDNAIGLYINNFFNQRIHYSFKAISTFGFTIVGIKNVDYINNGIVLDVSYINLICRFGLLYIFILYFICKKISNSDNIVDKILMIIWLFFAMSETAALSLIICFSPLLATIENVKGEDLNEQNT